MDEVERQALLRLLAKDPLIQKVLERAVAKEKKKEFREYGWEAADIGAQGHQIGQLRPIGLIDVVHKSNKHAYYVLHDRTALQGFLRDFKAGTLKVEKVEKAEKKRAKAEEAEEEAEEQSEAAPELPAEIIVYNLPKGFLETIYNFDDIKQFVKMVLQAKEPLNLGLFGPPACAKSLFLEEIGRLDGAFFCLGGSTTKAGLAKLLFDHKPSILLIDEADKMSMEDYATILSLAETGRVTETKGVAGRTRTIHLKCRVVIAGNDWRKIPREVLSRHMEFHIRPYTPEEYKLVVLAVAKQRGFDKDLADYLADKIIAMPQADIRDAVQVMKLNPTSKVMVDMVLEVLKKYQRPAE